MKLKDKYNYCKVCLNRNMDYERGLLCSITDEKPEFAESCPTFDLDEKNAERLENVPDIKKILKSVYVDSNKPSGSRKGLFSFLK